MTADAFYLLKLIFGTLSGVCLIAAAWFEVKDRSQTVKEREIFRAIYRKRWTIIENKGFLELPEKAISKVLERISNFTKSAELLVVVFVRKIVTDYLIIFVLTTIAFSSLSSYLLFGFAFAIISSIPIVSIIFIIVYYAIQKENDPDYGKKSIYFLFSINLIFTSVNLLILILRTPSLYATITMILATPIFIATLVVVAFLITFIVEHTSKRKPRFRFQTFGLAISVSFSITMIALYMGKIASPSSWVPQTLQMFLSNVFFDGLTTLATISILRSAVRDKRRIPIPFLISLDLLIAALLACASLYFGLVLTERAVTITESLRVLVGISTKGLGMDFGPYFWAMHTAFIPTLIYLAIIMFCWIGKIAILPIATLFKKGASVEKPHHLTAGAFALIGVIFAVVTTLSGHIENELINREANPLSVNSKQLFENKIGQFKSNHIENYLTQKSKKP